MKYSLNQVWEQAKSFKKSACLDFRREEAYIYKGIKITKNNDNINIYSTNNAQFQYHEMKEDQYDLFMELGFVDATHEIVKSIYQNKINKINDKIKNEINTRNNKKHYDSLKFKRDNLINKYSNITKK